MKVSIVIPHYGDRAYDLLEPCLRSIYEYTDLKHIEVIVVANGCTDSTLIVRDRFPQTELIWFNNALGYAVACNAGIKEAEGDYIVLLNNDTQLLAQPKNKWLDILEAPFVDERVAITGPWMNFNTEINLEFLIFFCCMIRKSALDKVGLLDEIFGAGYGEDVDLCCRMVNAGYKLVQVPETHKLPYDGKIAVGQFPIYHAGNATFKNWPGGEELMARNHAILRERYGGLILGNAQKLSEWLSDSELRFLALNAKKSKVAIELGSWHGKSATVIADNLPDDGVLWCIDTWNGSDAEKDTNHVSAREMDGDHAYDTFCRNLKDHIVSGKVRTLRIHGKHGAKLLLDMGVKADMIFLDAGHTYKEVQEDIYSLLPLRKYGGIICGHDYMQPIHPEVTPAVLDIFGGNMGQVPDTSIWATDAPPLVQPKESIFDCFTFNNELDILEKRFEALYDTVDRFVIVESTVTHSGKPKELVFHSNLDRFRKYLNKVTYIVVEDSPKMNGSEDSAWAIERHQRDAIMRGLKGCKDNDIIIVSDCDEIPNPSAIKVYLSNGMESIAALEMQLYLYDYSVKASDPWLHAKILKYWELKMMSPCTARYAHETENVLVIKNGGQHLSYFGGVDAIKQKIENTAHRNIDVPEFKTTDHIQKCIDEGLDLFGRDIKYEKSHS